MHPSQRHRAHPAMKPAHRRTPDGKLPRILEIASARLYPGQNGGATFVFACFHARAIPRSRRRVMRTARSSLVSRAAAGINGRARRGRTYGDGRLPAAFGAPYVGWGEVEFLAPLKVGERVTHRSTIATISAMQERSEPFHLVAVDHDFAINRRTVIRERRTLFTGARRRTKSLPQAKTEGKR